MSYAQHLQELLRPLGVYRMEAPFQQGELAAAGEGLDGVEDQLEETWREASLLTARSWGLEQIATLLARRPAATTPQGLGVALGALLRIGGDSFTLAAINDTIAGCGIPAKVEELGVGAVEVSFPGVVGVPTAFESLKPIIEDILPAHLSIKYFFWYLIWDELEERFPHWQDVEGLHMTWYELERYVKNGRTLSPQHKI